jgi:hypothetical protein
MRIIVTQKGNEVLRGILPSISPIQSKVKEMTPNIKLIKVKIENFKSKELYNRNVLELKHISRSISIRESDYGIFNTPYIKKDILVKKSAFVSSKMDIINNLKSLASSMKNSENTNIDQIVKKETVSPVFLKKIGISKNKIGKLEKIKIANFKYNIIKS